MTSSGFDAYSALDYWDILMSYKKIFLLIFFIIFAVGAVIAYVKEPVYLYRDIMIPAHYRTSDGIFALIQQPKDLEIQLRYLIIPPVIRQYNSKVKSKKLIMETKAIQVKQVDDMKSFLIDLSVRGHSNDQDRFQCLFNQIETGINELERPDMAKNKATWLSMLAASLRERSNFVKLNGTVSKEVSQLKGLETLSSRRAASTAASLSSGDILLQMSQATAHFVTSSVLDHMVRVQEHIDSIKGRLNTLEYTHYAAAMQRSARPVGLTAKVILVIFFVLGLLAAFITVVFIDYIARSRKLRVVKKTRE